MKDDIQQAFHKAVQENDLETTRRMIAAGADVNAPYDEYKNRSFLDACYRGNLDLVKMLVEAGADVNLPDSCGTVPLVRAIVSIHNTNDVVKYLLDCGAEVNACDGESWTPLEAAVREHATDLVKLLLEAGAKPNITGSELGSPLSIVMQDKEFRSAEILIKFGAKFSNNEDYYTDEVLENINDHTLFFNMKDNGIILRTDDEAVILYSRHACSYLLHKALEAGANPNATDATGKSALEWSLEHPRHPQGCAVRLIRKGATFSPHLLILAVRKQYRELAAALIQAGADANSTDELGNTALHYAARTNRDYFVRDLIAAGASLEARNHADYTPLMLAVRYRSYAASTVLLENKANTYSHGGKYHENVRQMCIRYHCRLDGNKLCKVEWNTRTMRNLTPYRFYWAASAGDESKIQALQQQGCNINAYTEDGCTALHLCEAEADAIDLLIRCGADMYAETREATDSEPVCTAPELAADFGDWPTIQKFLDCGYDVNHVNSQGRTLLMDCAVCYWPQGVRKLLEFGANPSIKDKNGQTALFYATCYNIVCYDETIDYLIEYGANINEVDNEGNTALLAIADQEIDGDRTHCDLIGRGIDVNIRNKAGETALSIAKRHGHTRLIKELMEAGAKDV